MERSPAIPDDIAQVLEAYPVDCQPLRLECLGGAGGFSGASFWRLETRRGPLCLRRWPPEHPDNKQLEFIHSVLWFAEREGFSAAPVPIPTNRQISYVSRQGRLWELAPWMPGRADFLENPRPEKLRAAMTALAGFHTAVAGFPVADAGPACSPGIIERLERVRELRAGGLTDLDDSILSDPRPDLAACAKRLVALASRVAAEVQATLEGVAKLRVALQPCLRDIWSDHVLFDGDDVTGLIDFGAMRAENVAADISRLLGSMAADSGDSWESGLAAYETVRPIGQNERALIRAMDQSSVLLSGLNWVEWIYRHQRTFERLDTVLQRMIGIEKRLRFLTEGQ